MREEEAARALGKKLTDSESARPNRNVKKIEFNPFEENIRKMREEEEAGGEEDRRDLAALAREKLALMKKGDPAAVRDFVLRSKEREYERREREAAEAEEEEEGEEGGE